MANGYLLISKLGVIEQWSGKPENLCIAPPMPNESIWNVFSSEMHTCLWALMQRCRFTHQEQTDEVQVHTAEGLRWVEISILPQGNSFAIELRDVTARKKVIEKIIEEKQQSSIGTLAGGLAHRYNNIHHAVLGFLETSLRLEEKERVNTIKLAIQKIESGTILTKSLLDYSRGHSEKSICSFYLEEIFEQVRRLTRDEVLRNNCNLNLPHTQEIVRGNKAVLEQILVHLVTNSIHACMGRAQREISLSTKYVGPYCRIQVRDTGCGISESDQKRIFTPFFTTKGEFAPQASPAAQVRGQGLALALSRRFARQFNGDLILKRTSHNGSIFELSVPKGEESEIAQPKGLAFHSMEKKKARGPNEKLNFLILDDLPENRVVLKFYLKDRANKICENESGDVSISQLEELGPDIIFVDWLMPGVNGHQFLSRLRKNQRFDLLKRVYILSGYNDSAEIESWRPFVAGVIEKPISREKLLSQVLCH